MLLSPAYAAESGASDSTADAAVATAAEAQSLKLVFASDKTLTGANGDTVKEIFKSRLDALGYKDYTLTLEAKEQYAREYGYNGTDFL